MKASEDLMVSVAPARVGRPASRSRLFSPDELVRVEVRMPAVIAAQVFALASDSHRPVSVTASELLAEALIARGGRLSS